MLAKRPQRRYSNQPSTQIGREDRKNGIFRRNDLITKNQGDTSKEIRKSKYSILELEEGEACEVDLNEEGSREDGTESTSDMLGNKAMLQGKGRRVNVQVQDISIKEPLKGRDKGSVSNTTGMTKQGSRNNMGKGKGENSGGRNQAAAADKHWVVSGSTKLNFIRKEKGLHDPSTSEWDDTVTVMEMDGLNPGSRPPGEHHWDPPDNIAAADKVDGEGGEW